MTVVRPAPPVRVAELDGDGTVVAGFHEKPRSEHWVNGGFFCFQPDGVAYLAEDSGARARPTRAVWPPTVSCTRHTLGLHGHATGHALLAVALEAPPIGLSLDR